MAGVGIGGRWLSLPVRDVREGIGEGAGCGPLGEEIDFEVGPASFADGVEVTLLGCVLYRVSDCQRWCHVLCEVPPLFPVSWLDLGFRAERRRRADTPGRSVAARRHSSDGQPGDQRPNNGD